MVRRNCVFPLLFAAGLLSLACSAWASATSPSPSLKVEMHAAAGELGKAIPVTITAGGKLPPLTTLALSAWRRDFHVLAQESELEADAGVQRWPIQLYPRRLGRQVVPALHFSGLQTEPLEIMVTPAMDKRTRQEIDFETGVSAASVWVMQALQVEMTVETANPYVSLETESFSLPGARVIALPRVSETVTGQGAVNHRTRHRLAWKIYQQVPGRQSVQLPALLYMSSGVVQQRFYPPALDLEVRRLPAYVPATLPVGSYDLRVQMPDKLYLLRRELVYLNLTVEGEGMLSPALAAVTRQFKSNSELIIYPSMGRENGLSDEGARQLTYQLALAPRTSGLLTLPALRLQYFDPESGRIETRYQETGRLLVLSAWMVYLGLGLVVLLVLGLLGYSAGKVKRFTAVLHHYHAACRLLRAGGDKEAARRALREMALAENWSPNLSLRSWLHHWHARYRDCDKAAGAVAVLENSLFGKGQGEARKANSILLQLCYRRLPILRILP